MLDKSAVAEHAWKDDLSIRWTEATVVDKGKHLGQLPLKEALHIHMTPAEECLNRDTRIENLERCWTVVLRKQEVRTKPHCTATSGDTH